MTEQARQYRIDQGMTNIKRMFDGGKWGAGRVDKYDPNATYFTRTGEAWAAPAGTDPVQSTKDAIAKNLLYTRQAKSEGYGDEYYKKRADDYLAYATPQVMEDYRHTKNNLAYSLARNGALNSSVALQRKDALDKELAKNEGNLAQAAQGQVNQARAQVADTRSNLVNQLVASADPSLIAENANAATAGLRAPTAFQPLGNLFQDWTQTYLANMNAKAYDPSTPSLWKQFSGGAA